MRIIRASLRVSLLGGGCDRPEYYVSHGATVVSFALDRSIYLTYNVRPTGGYRLSYSQTEELDDLCDARHTLVRAAAEQYGPLPPCTLSIVSDLPAGTGLGSSSALSVALVKMFGKSTQPAGLASEAYYLERQVADVGFQDSLPASFGGLRIYRADRNGRVVASDRLTDLERMVEDYGVLLYTGQMHDTATVIKRWNDQPAILKAIHDLADGFTQELSTMTPRRLAEYLHATWQLKSAISGVSNRTLDEQYSRALDSGALGGKLLGSGSGGCWFFIVERDHRQAVIDRFGMAVIPFRISAVGCTDVYI